MRIPSQRHCLHLSGHSCPGPHFQEGTSIQALLAAAAFVTSITSSLFLPAPQCLASPISVTKSSFPQPRSLPHHKFLSQMIGLAHSPQQPAGTGEKKTQISGELRIQPFRGVSFIQDSLHWAEPCNPREDSPTRSFPLSLKWLCLWTRGLCSTILSIHFAGLQRLGNWGLDLHARSF